MVERTPGIALALNPYIGYEKAAQAVKESLKTGKSIRDVVRQKGWLSEEELGVILDLYSMTEPGVKGRRGKVKRAARKKVD
jgi:aspartate ammonia-lyase